MFAHPRPKRSALPPPGKRRKTHSGIEEINFDFAAREEYLTGFHKRKLQRAKAAEAQNAKKAREDRLLQRKQLREERRQELEAHLKQVNNLLKKATNIDSDESGSEDDEEWDGIPDEDPVDYIDHEDEYVDEDWYTTVTVEAVDVSKDGLHKAVKIQESGEYDGQVDRDKNVSRPRDNDITRRKWPKKEKTKKFRYESKAERKLEREKQKSGKKARAAQRRDRD